MGGDIVGVDSCDTFPPLWHYDPEAGECGEVWVFGCSDGPLLFATLKECQSVCESTTTTTTTTTG
jgi:hypothetical protein